MEGGKLFQLKLQNKFGCAFQIVKITHTPSLSMSNKNTVATVSELSTYRPKIQILPTTNKGNIGTAEK